MVRHEAAEAAGAIGCPEAWRLVEEHLGDATREVAETCQLAVQRMAWYEKKQEEEEEKKRVQKKKKKKKGDRNDGGDGDDDDDDEQQEQQQKAQEGQEEEEEEEEKVVIKRYLSVDPAPPAAPGTPADALVAALLDESAATPIFDRYRALFSLRDEGGAAAVAALCAALRRSRSALLKHEVAYVLGRNAPGIFEIALWMRGFENYYCDMVANQAFAEALLDAIMEVKMKYWARAPWGRCRSASPTERSTGW